MIESMFEQYDLRGFSLPNRWAMAPMTRKQSPGRVPTDAVAEYYRRRAAGGVGLIITEGTLVDHPLASPEDTIPQITPDTVTAWRTVVEKVHEEGARILVQLWHQGPIARPGISATPLVEDGVEVVSKANSHQEQLLADAFVGGAVSAKAAGFDGVEFHGAHGYLLDSFLRAGRLDYFCDLVRETRNQVGPELLLALRFSQWTVRDHSARQFDTPQHLERALLGLKEAGIDVFHASTRRFWLPEFDGSDLNLAGWTRKITEAPTIIVGNIGLSTANSVAMVRRAPENCNGDSIKASSTWRRSVVPSSVIPSGVTRSATGARTPSSNTRKMLTKPIHSIHRRWISGSQQALPYHPTW